MGGRDTGASLCIRHASFAGNADNRATGVSATMTPPPVFFLSLVAPALHNRLQKKPPTPTPLKEPLRPIALTGSRGVFVDVQTSLNNIL